MWKECELNTERDDAVTSKSSTPARRNKFNTRPGSKSLGNKGKHHVRSLSANTSRLPATPTEEVPGGHNNRTVKSAVNRQKSVIESQRLKLREQQKQIDELRALKDQLDMGRAITNKVAIIFYSYIIEFSH